MLRVSALLLRKGIPAIPIVATGFMNQARAVARALGVANIEIAEYPGLPMNDAELLPEKVAANIVPTVRDWIARGGQTSSDKSDSSKPLPTRPRPDKVIFRGSLEDVVDHFNEHGWSDGLPIVPPTIGRVTRFLERTVLPADHVIGVFPPEKREVSVWDVAVNGVMAGCRPEYMPVLVAATEAVVDPDFRLEDAGSTPGWEPLVVISGTIADELDFHHGTGVMRVGRQANTTVGRYVRLIMRNFSGLRIPPGDLDRGSIGASFNVALAEDEAAINSLGWPSFREDRGYAHSESTVTVQSVVATSPPIYCGGSEPTVMLEMLVEIMKNTCGPWSYTGIRYRRWHPLILLSPDIAQRLHSAGWDKPKLQGYLFDSLELPAYWLEQYPAHVAGSARLFRDQVDSGELPAYYASSSDPMRPIKILLRPEWTGIVIAGDAQRNQARVYVNNHCQGPPITRAIRL